MAVVRTPAERIRDRLAVAAVIAITIVMLAPIYWIASTAFKPRSLATTVPPTVFFKPEITPFIKLFTKRVQLLRPVAKATYDGAPWWERLIYDGGERVLKVGGDGHHHGLRLLAIPDSRRARPVVLYSVDADAAAGRRGDPDVSDVPPGRAGRHPSRADYPLYRLQPIVFGVVDERLHRRDTEGIRGGRTGGRLHAIAGVSENRNPRVVDRNCGDRSLLLYHRLERVRLCADDD